MRTAVSNVTRTVQQAQDEARIMAYDFLRSLIAHGVIDATQVNIANALVAADTVLENSWQFSGDAPCDGEIVVPDDACACPVLNEIMQEVMRDDPTMPPVLFIEFVSEEG